MASTLQSGMSVSRYRVLGPLGAGGMGEVYQAQDTTLERPVALKILPPELVRNDERVRRFMQEAKSASSLNHPNIVTILEIGQASVSVAGSEERPIHYIAMELIDGATLKRKIHQEDTDLRTLLGWLAQCADGLAKAHAAGLVHRDLKPENIMVTRDGFAKVLDFGLAKLSVRKSSDGSTDATAVRVDTREGAVLGTVAYMSPEQVQGKVVDHRSDIFSFGCILYEAATRQRPFEADSDVDVMHKILHDKPPAIDEIRPEVPAELRRVIRRCMAKDPERRYQSMRDLALELGEIVDEFEELSASAASRSSGSVSQPVQIGLPASRRKLWMAGASVALVVLAAVGFGVWQWLRARSEKPPINYDSMRFDPLTASGKVRSCAISPDGKYVAYVSTVDGKPALMVRQIATRTDVQILPPQEASIQTPVFSADGNYIDYREEQGKGPVRYSSLYQIATLGGAPKKLLFDIDSAVSFSPDGKQMAFGRRNVSKREGSIVIANTDGTGERTLASFKVSTSVNVAWSPDGKTIVTTRRGVSPQGDARLIAVDVATGKENVIGPSWRGITSVCWMPDGSGVVIAANDMSGIRQQIWLQPYPSGNVVRMTNDMNMYRDLSITADGKTISALLIDMKIDLFVSAPSDPGGGSLFPNITGTRYVYTVDAIPSGALVYSFLTERGANIAMVDQKGKAPRILTTDNSARAVLSSDGKLVTYVSMRDGTPHVWVMNADGSGPRQVTFGKGEQLAACRDGRNLFYVGEDGERTALMRMPLAGGPSVKLADGVVTFKMSPSGRRILYGAIVTTAEGRTIANGTVIDPEGNVLYQTPPLPTAVVTFTPAEDGLAIVVNSDRISDVFVQPFNGGPRRQIAHFTNGPIAGLEFLPDGELLLRRVDSRSDAVLIQNFR